MKKRNKERRVPYRAIAETLCAVIALLCFLGVWYFHANHASDKNTNLIITVFLAFSFVAISVFIIVAFNTYAMKKAVRKPSGPMLGSIMYDMVNNADDPALIYDENKKIIWYNRYAMSLSSSTLLGAKLSTIIPAPVPEESDKRD